MKLSTLATSVLLIPTLAACSRPAMAQHPRGGHAAHGQGANGHGMPHGNPGMPHVPPHVQAQIQEQQRQYQQHMQRMQQEAHQQYQRDLQQFDRWLTANGGGSGQGNGGGSGRLPNNPDAFDQWALHQQQRKARGLSYDPLFDQYRAFVGSMSPGGSRQGRTQTGPPPSSAHVDRKNDPQAGAAGSMAGPSATDHQARRGGPTGAAGATAGPGKHAEIKHEERRRAELGREERARHLRARERRPLVLDQTSISMMRTVHTRLQEADHDYDGHRVRALHRLGEALHFLGSSAPPSVPAAASLGNLPQAQSDGILRDAIFKLRLVEGRLGGQAGGAPHHARARAAVGQAIEHLELALRIR